MSSTTNNVDSASVVLPALMQRQCNPWDEINLRISPHTQVILQDCQIPDSDEMAAQTADDGWNRVINMILQTFGS